MPPIFERKKVCFLDPEDMAAAVKEDLATPSMFLVKKAYMVSSKGAHPMVSAVLSRQRDSMINNVESRRVDSSSVDSYICEDIRAHALLPEMLRRQIFSRAMDRNARELFVDLGLCPARLAEIGVVCCGGSMLESALRPSPLTRADVGLMRQESGFDIDLFVAGDVPYRGSVDAYVDLLVSHVHEDRRVLRVQTSSRGFCTDVLVGYDDDVVVNLQVIDVGVDASPMTLIGSFDLAPCKMYFCASSNRIVMTEDAALSMANGVIPYDRRFMDDPRYPARLRKYCLRTGFGLHLDAMASAVMSVVEVIGADLTAEFHKRAPEHRSGLCDAVGSWLEEMPVSDASVFASVGLGELGGRCSRRGYSCKRRVQYPALTGGCGRFNLRQMGSKAHPIVELHGLFVLKKMLEATRPLP
jgi:hypothetical protein